MMNASLVLRAAGFLFTWRRMTDRLVRVSLWRVDAATGRRFWVSCALAADDRDAIRARALALFTWARSIPTSAGLGVQAQAVNASLTITAQRMASLGLAADAIRARRRGVAQRRAA